MHARRPLGERTRAAIGAWLPLDVSETALLVIAALTALLFAGFLHRLP
jgi:hypothetical protein